MVVTGPVGKLFGNLESYSVDNQIHGLVSIEPGALVESSKPARRIRQVGRTL